MYLLFLAACFSIAVQLPVRLCNAEETIRPPFLAIELTSSDNCVLFMFAGFESILEGICGPMLLGDLKLHDGGFYAYSIIHVIISLSPKYLLTYLFSKYIFALCNGQLRQMN